MHRLIPPFKDYYEDRAATAASLPDGLLIDHQRDRTIRPATAAESEEARRLGFVTVDGVVCRVIR